MAKLKIYSDIVDEECKAFMAFGGLSGMSFLDIDKFIDSIPTDDAEIKQCVEMLIRTDGGTGFMHESFNVDEPTNFTRKWFAWQNTLFGELIVKLIAFHNNLFYTKGINSNQNKNQDNR